MAESTSRTSPRRILNILEEIIVDPDNFTARSQYYVSAFYLLLLHDFYLFIFNQFDVKWWNFSRSQRRRRENVAMFQ